MSVLEDDFAERLDIDSRIVVLSRSFPPLLVGNCLCFGRPGICLFGVAPPTKIASAVAMLRVLPHAVLADVADLCLAGTPAVAAVTVVVFDIGNRGVVLLVAGLDTGHVAAPTAFTRQTASPVLPFARAPTVCCARRRERKPVVVFSLLGVGMCRRKGQARWRT